MLKPVQRFPQFLLILQDLLSNTAFDHVDRVKIERAVTTLDKLTEQLDQRREIQEQHQLYQKLMNRLVFENLFSLNSISQSHFDTHSDCKIAKINRYGKIRQISHQIENNNCKQKV